MNEWIKGEHPGIKPGLPQHGDLPQNDNYKQYLIRYEPRTHRVSERQTTTP